MLHSIKYILVLLMVLFLCWETGWTQSSSPGQVTPLLVSSSDDLKVFPNPSNGRFRLIYKITGSEKPEAKVYDLTGKLVKDITKDLVIGEDMVSADVELQNPKSGIYFLRFGIGQKRIAKKVIIR